MSLQIAHWIRLADSTSPSARSPSPPYYVEEGDSREGVEAEQSFSVYTENEIKPGLISLKNNDLNIIFPNPLGDEEKRENGEE